jgi:hypothetical protein
MKDGLDIVVVVAYSKQVYYPNICLLSSACKVFGLKFHPGPSEYEADVVTTYIVTPDRAT